MGVLRRLPRFRLCLITIIRRNGIGSGAGKGGGSGGSIREAGGMIGEVGAAREETYFRKMSYELLEKLRMRKEKELEYHRQQLLTHQKALARAERELKDIHEAKDNKFK